MCPRNAGCSTDIFRKERSFPKEISRSQNSNLFTRERVARLSRLVNSNFSFFDDVKVVSVFSLANDTLPFVIFIDIKSECKFIKVS